MKKTTLIALASLPMLFSANAIDKQVYDQPGANWPEAFSWQMQRTDYRGTDDAGQPVAVNTQQVNVVWEPDYMNQSACYGKLTVENFFDHEWVQQTASIEFTNEGNHNFQVSDDGKTITFSFTGYFFSMASTDEAYANAYGKLSQYALLARAKKGTSSTYSRYWLYGEGSYYAYNGGVALDCVLDLENKTITISQPWGAFMCKDQYGAASSYVIEYFESSSFVYDGSTAITDVKAETPASDGYYYNLAGQRVANPTAGIYIRNGKKIVVK